MALSWRPFTLTRVTDLSLYPLHPPKPPPSPPPSSLFLLPRPRRSFLVSCVVDGFSDDAVSTRKSSFDRGFTVIANMLRRIEPLDNSVISKGVSHAARDSMKQTISTMLGLLPSDQFSVTVTVSKHPLHRLLFSSIITGYTLWNAEYRMSLIRNLDISRSEIQGSDCETSSEVLEVKSEGQSDEKIEAVSDLESCSTSPRVFGDLPPQALSYIQQLQFELTSVKEGRWSGYISL